MPDIGVIITIVISVGTASGSLALFIANQFKQHRHYIDGRLRYRDRRVLRLELFLHERLGFDLTSDMPLLDDEEGYDENLRN